jgi:hypothetical protein
MPIRTNRVSAMHSLGANVDRELRRSSTANDRLEPDGSGSSGSCPPPGRFRYVLDLATSSTDAPAIGAMCIFRVQL